MQHLISYGLNTLPELVRLGKLSEDEKLALKEKLLTGDAGVVSALQILMKKHAGYVPKAEVMTDYDETCETLRCCLKISANTTTNTSPLQEDFLKNLSHSVFTEMNASSVTLLFAAPQMDEVAQEAVNASNGALVLGNIHWHRFDTANGWPNLYIEQAHCLQFNDVMFLASFHSPDVVFEQLSAIYAIARYACKSLKVIIPFFPTGTMERIERIGEVATASTLARIISVTPHSAQGPTQLVFLDIHALQEQFYFTDQVLVHLKSCIHLLKNRLKQLAKESVEKLTIVFPDDGACKRFGNRFKGFNIVVCHKVRDGESRKVVIRDGFEFVPGCHCIIVDDLVKSGGTLLECGKALYAAGAKYVSAYVTHGVFPEESWKKFAWDKSAVRRRTSSVADTEHWQFLGGRVADNMDRVSILPSPTQCFDHESTRDTPRFRYFWMTNSIPDTAIAVRGIRPFEVLSIAPLLTYLRRIYFSEEQQFD